MNNPPIWKMVSEAVEFFNREVSYTEIKEYILNKYKNVNKNTITYQIIAITVNHSSRIHYPENQKPRITDGSSQYDVLYHTGRGRVIKYNRAIHGLWEIYKVSESLGIREYNSNKKTFLFIWQPSQWPWENLKLLKKKVDEQGFAVEPWSSGNTTKAITSGERFFLLKLGGAPSGIIGSGYINSHLYESRKDWKNNELYNAVDLQFDTILNPYNDSILTLDKLEESGLTEQEWHPRASGISLNNDYVKHVESLWFNTISSTEDFVADINDDVIYLEGAKVQRLLNVYERNTYARKVCLDYYGYNCSVCKMNFEQKYGTIGRNFIHVHHLSEISKSSREYTVNPIADLRPVCPNCHAMLHKKSPPFSIEELTAIIQHIDND